MQLNFIVFLLFGIISLSFGESIIANNLLDFEEELIHSVVPYKTSENDNNNIVNDDNNVVVVITASGGIFGVDYDTGNIVWGYNTGNKLFSSSSPTVVPGLDGLIYFANEDGVKV
jgi:outer membrane protein assembly factor BamB